MNVETSEILSAITASVYSRFDQIGQYDVPANLRYILAYTNQATLSYVGHSQGTLTFYIAMETNPDLNEKVNMMFALAPITTVAHMRSPLRLIAPYADNLEANYNLFFYIFNDGKKLLLFLF